MKILYLSRSGRLKLYEKYLNGDEPADFLYGFRKILSKYPDSAKIVEVSTDNRLINRIINRIAQAWCGQNFHLNAVRDVLSEEGSEFIAYTNIDSIALALCYLKRKGQFKGKIVHISQGLTNVYETKEITGIRAKLSQKWLRSLLSEVDCLVVLGLGAQQALRSYFNLESLYIPFGVDLNYWDKNNVITQNTENYLLSVGSDGNRDFETLLNAKINLPLKIVTRLKLPNSGGCSEQLDVNSSDELRSVYGAAMVVIITLKDVSQPSGQSTAMQALAMGKKIIMTRTKGLWDPDFLENLVQCTLIEKCDKMAIENAVSELPSGDLEFSRNNDSLIKDSISIERFENAMLSHVENLMV